jgi:hypothetical protein
MSDQPYTGPEIQEAVRIIKEDAILSGQRAQAERLDRIEDQLKRVPGKEMTPEEKAAEYDKIIAERNATPAKPAPPEPTKTDTPTPPPPKSADTDPPKPKRDPWFGDALS